MSVKNEFFHIRTLLYVVYYVLNSSYSPFLRNPPLRQHDTLPHLFRIARCRIEFNQIPVVFSCLIHRNVRVVVCVLILRYSMHSLAEQEPPDITLEQAF